MSGEELKKVFLFMINMCSWFWPQIGLQKYYINWHWNRVEKKVFCYQLEKGLKKAELINTSGIFLLSCFHYNMCVVYLILVTNLFAIVKFVIIVILALVFCIHDNMWVVFLIMATNAIVLNVKTQEKTECHHAHYDND